VVADLPISFERTNKGNDLMAFTFSVVNYSPYIASGVIQKPIIYCCRN